MNEEGLRITTIATILEVIVIMCQALAVLSNFTRIDSFNL